MQNLTQSEVELLILASHCESEKMSYHEDKCTKEVHVLGYKVAWEEIKS
jgi:hypothetical protein